MTSCKLVFHQKKVYDLYEQLPLSSQFLRGFDVSYEYGSHFVFPQSMLEIVLPIGSTLLLKLAFKTLKEHPDACRQTRIDIDKRLRRIIQGW